MPRDKFISDNLINIRDYLREKCADIAQEQSAPEVQAEQQEIHLNLKTAVSSGNSGFSRSSEREYNEFAGHLQHDLAAVGAELANTEIKQKELENFNAQLLDIVRKLQELPVQNSQDFFREFDRLKIMYFQSSGRVSAFRRAGGNAPAPTPAAHTVKPPARKPDILLSVSILISALLISLTLLIVFA